MAIRDPNGDLGADPKVKNVREKFADTAAVMAAVDDSMRNVRILHKRMGVGLVGWKDGKMVEIPPEEIQIDDPPPAESK
jgi:hypothetical protein